MRHLNDLEKSYVRAALVVAEIHARESEELHARMQQTPLDCCRSNALKDLRILFGDYHDVLVEDATTPRAS